MENIIQFHKMTPDDLGSLIKSILNEELKKILLSLKKDKDDEFLTREEAADFLRISKTTLYTLDKNQVLPAKRLEGKVLYLKSDLLNFDRESA